MLSGTDSVCNIPLAAPLPITSAVSIKYCLVAAVLGLLGPINYRLFASPSCIQHVAKVAAMHRYLSAGMRAGWMRGMIRTAGKWAT